MTMTNNVPVVLRVVLTPQEPFAPSAEVVRDWVAREVNILNPVVIDHVADNGARVRTTYAITSVELANR
jgi:hypothetical protein